MAVWDQESFDPSSFFFFGCLQILLGVVSQS